MLFETHNNYILYLKHNTVIIYECVSSIFLNYIWNYQGILIVYSNEMIEITPKTKWDKDRKLEMNIGCD